MTKAKMEDLKGIDETVIFQRLWSKRIFIFVVIGLCFICGLISISQQSASYTVALKILFNAKNSEHMGNLFHYGNIDFALYSKNGKIEHDDSLRFSLSEQELLQQYKGRININVNYPQGCVTLSGNTTDTLMFMKELKTVGQLLQKNMISLLEKYSRETIDTLRFKQNRIQNTLEKGLRELLEFQEQHKNFQDIDTQIQVKLAEYKYVSLCNSLFSKLEQLKESENQLKITKITLSSPQSKLSGIQQSKCTLLMRWLFFGFMGSCILVLVGFQIQSVLKNRRD